MTKNRPVHEVRLGFVKASIWENTSNDVTRMNVTIQKFYKDGDQWKSTESFGRDDLLVLAKVVDRAHSWICDKPASTAPA
jgi:hypothetical protein